MYVGKVHSEINMKSNAGDDAAVDRKFAEERALIATVKPTTDAARADKAKVEASVAGYERQIAESRLERLSRPELEARLRAGADDAYVWHLYRYKADMEIGPKTASDKAAAGKAIAEVKATLRSIKPTSREALSEAAELQKVIGRYEEQLERDRRQPLESATLWELDVRVSLDPHDALALEYYLKGARGEINARARRRRPCRGVDRQAEETARCDPTSRRRNDPVARGRGPDGDHDAGGRIALIRATPSEQGAWLKAHPDDGDAQRFLESVITASWARSARGRAPATSPASRRRSPG